jgi:hypothetical protein
VLQAVNRLTHHNSADVVFVPPVILERFRVGHKGLEGLSVEIGRICNAGTAEEQINDDHQQLT